MKKFTIEQQRFLVICESLINLGKMDFEYPSTLKTIIKRGYTLDAIETSMLKKLRNRYIEYIKQN